MKHIEETHQIMIVNWAQIKKLSSSKYPVFQGARVKDYLIASANGGSRNKSEAARLKRTGVSAGFPDLQLTLAIGGYHGLFIELKRPIVKGQAKPTISPLQKQWNTQLNDAGYLAIFCYGFDDAISTIEKYLIGDL